MVLWYPASIIIVLLTAGLARCQFISDEQCHRQDGTVGVCREIQDCLDHNGNIESPTRIVLCSSSFTKIRACCRSSAAYIAEQKCNEWKRLANLDGAACRTIIPLAIGRETKVGEFPHIVSILIQAGLNKLVHICGGVLISNRYVLTAAHCTDHPELIVRIGGHDLRIVEPGVTVDSYVTNPPKRHSGYRKPLKYNDIALLRLRVTVSFSKRVRPACLPYNNVRIPAGAKMEVAGWGAFDNAGATSQVLRKAEVTAIDRLKCDSNPVLSDFVSMISYPAGITDSIICADESEGGACSGDSGGPLMRVTSSTCEVKEVVGIVSRGIPECRRTTVPGTYTRIEYYLDWIVQNVWKDELY